MVGSAWRWTNIDPTDQFDYYVTRAQRVEAFINMERWSLFYYFSNQTETHPRTSIYTPTYPSDC